MSLDEGFDFHEGRIGVHGTVWVFPMIKNDILSLGRISSDSITLFLAPPTAVLDPERSFRLAF
jgi:hypothetical protein